MDSISMSLALINAQHCGDHMGVKMIMSMQNAQVDLPVNPEQFEAIDANDMRAIAQIIAHALGLDTALAPQQLLATSDPNVFLLGTPEDVTFDEGDGEDMFFASEIQPVEIIH